MSWQTVTLGDIATFSNGINFDKSAYTSGVKFIGVSNFGDRFKPDYSELSEVKKEVVRKSEYLADGDIVFVRSNGNKALVGRCMLVQNAPEPVTFSGFCIRCHITDTTLFDPVFMTYHFKSAMFRQAMSGTAVGANIQNLSQGRMTAYTAKIPDIETQRRIASILSAYDDLVENNRKQIKLLEEAAQRLYKEWFVDLRFPGWETAEIVDGVPVGWKEGVIGDIVCYHDKIRKPLSSMQRSSFQGQYRYYGAAGILDHVKEYLFDGTYLLFGEDGTVITPDGNPVLQYVSGKFWVNNHAHVLTGVEPISTEFIYMMFKKIGVSDVVTGVAQPKISQSRLSNKKIVIPSTDLIMNYQRIVKPNFDSILNLEKQIQYALEARDRLLPKLMSGELEV